MNQHTQALSNDVSQLANDARALLSATADVAGEKVVEARQRLTAALESGKEMYGRVKTKADAVVQEHPYQAIAIGVGVGALLGYLITRQCACKRA